MDPVNPQDRLAIGEWILVALKQFPRFQSNLPDFLSVFQSQGIEDTADLDEFMQCSCDEQEPFYNELQKLRLKVDDMIVGYLEVILCKFKESAQTRMAHISSYHTPSRLVTLFFNDHRMCTHIMERCHHAEHVENPTGGPPDHRTLKCLLGTSKRLNHITHAWRRSPCDICQNCPVQSCEYDNDCRYGYCYPCSLVGPESSSWGNAPQLPCVCCGREPNPTPDTDEDRDY